MNFNDFIPLLTNPNYATLVANGIITVAFDGTTYTVTQQLFSPLDGSKDGTNVYAFMPSDIAAYQNDTNEQISANNDQITAIQATITGQQANLATVASFVTANPAPTQ